VNKGTLLTFKASDDEKFQTSSDHFNQFCTPPQLDENAEEGLTSCNVQQGQNKNLPATDLDFHYPHYHSWTLDWLRAKTENSDSSSETSS
jgi:hypothetical protein